MASWMEIELSLDKYDKLETFRKKTLWEYFPETS